MSSFSCRVVAVLAVAVQHVKVGVTVVCDTSKPTLAAYEVVSEGDVPMSMSLSVSMLSVASEDGASGNCTNP